MGKLGDRIRSFLGRNKPSAGREPEAPLSERLQRRIRRVSESFLDNERLTADLDDSAAQELLDWGLNLGSRIAKGTADVDDDEQADEAMYPRLRATRRLMRGVNRWVTKERERDQEGSREALNQIIEHAQAIYGSAFKPPSEELLAQFLQSQTEFLDNPPRLIANLRQLFNTADDNA
jgi:hypothetical protein